MPYIWGVTSENCITQSYLPNQVGKENLRCILLISFFFISRLSYHEAYYTALARGAYESWAEAERESGEQLVFKTGGLSIGKKGTVEEQVVRQYAQVLRKQGIP